MRTFDRDTSYKKTVLCQTKDHEVESIVIIMHLVELDNRDFQEILGYSSMLCKCMEDIQDERVE